MHLHNQEQWRGVQSMGVHVCSTGPPYWTSVCEEPVELVEWWSELPRETGQCIFTRDQSYTRTTGPGLLHLPLFY